MKVCRIVDEYDNKEVGYLLYYKRSDSFSVEISPELSAADATLFLEYFVEKGILSLGPEWSRRWVEARIVPRDRQNLGIILKDNGLSHYDAFRLLVLAEGRCAQDDCAVFQIKPEAMPEWLRERLSKRIDFVHAIEPSELVLMFRDETIWRVDIGIDMEEDGMLGAYLAKPGVFSCAELLPGGTGVTWNGYVDIPAWALSGRGERLPLTCSEFKSMVKKFVMDTSEVCDELECSRQYVNQLVKESDLSVLKESNNARLYARSEIDRIRD